MTSDTRSVALAPTEERALTAPAWDREKSGLDRSQYDDFLARARALEGDIRRKMLVARWQLGGIIHDMRAAATAQGEADTYGRYLMAHLADDLGAEVSVLYRCLDFYETVSESEIDELQRGATLPALHDGTPNIVAHGQQSASGYQTWGKARLVLTIKSRPHARELLLAVRDGVWRGQPLVTFEQLRHVVYELRRELGEITGPVRPAAAGLSSEPIERAAALYRKASVRERLLFWVLAGRELLEDYAAQPKRQRAADRTLVLALCQFGAALRAAEHPRAPLDA